MRPPHLGGPASGAASPSRASPAVGSAAPRGAGVGCRRAEGADGGKNGPLVASRDTLERARPHATPRSAATGSTPPADRTARPSPVTSRLAPTPEVQRSVCVAINFWISLKII
jgi:hypothetical protein